MILTLLNRKYNVEEQEVWIYNNAKTWRWAFDEWISKDGKPKYISGVYLDEDDTIAFRLKYGKG